MLEMNKIYILITSVFILISCKTEYFSTHSVKGEQTIVLGHGGMGISHKYPMNSYESIARCLDLGADGTEIDVQMTKDSVLVAFHDSDLSKSTNISGHISNMNWSVIQDAVYTKPVFRMFRIISLDSLFTRLTDIRDKTFVLDCKFYVFENTARYRATFCNALFKLIDKHQLHDNVIVELINPDMIRTLKEMRPEIRVFVYSDFEKGMSLTMQYQLQGLVMPVNVITKEQVAMAHQKGLKVAVFNVHTLKRNREAIQKGVDMIQTDRLKYLLKIMN